ncbi:glucose-1-phosphate cytidylyltransferase [Candidatus Margulisiibacteriota bacterium]
MKVVILAGGYGTRLSEETNITPKPMVEIGEKPILWHIMKTYSHFGFNEFIICLGYRGYFIKEYFMNYFIHHSNLTVDLAKNTYETHSHHSEPWKVTLVDTGKDTMTGGRIKRIKEYTNNQTFMLTYGDGVANIDINKLIVAHKKNNKYVTLTAVQPTGRFGALTLDSQSNIKTFKEKPKGNESWINGGFFVCEQNVFDYIEKDSTIFEQAPLENLARDNQLFAYKHQDFWHSMDKLKDKKDLNKIWNSGSAKWKIWK